MYEGGVRIPFIAKWKNVIAEGSESNEIIAFWDVMPTLADIIGYPNQIETDGISFFPVLSGDGKDKMKHEYLYWDYGHARNKYMQAIRYGKYKGIANFNEDGNVSYELYDLEKDMGENLNIALEHPGIMDKIKEYMSKAYVYSEAYPRKVTYK